MLDREEGGGIGIILCFTLYCNMFVLKYSIQFTIIYEDISLHTSIKINY